MNDYIPTNNGKNIDNINKNMKKINYCFNKKKKKYENMPELVAQNRLIIISLPNKVCFRNKKKNEVKILDKPIPFFSFLEPLFEICQQHYVH